MHRKSIRERKVTNVNNNLIDVDGVPFTMIVDENGNSINVVSGDDIQTLERYILTLLRRG